MANSGISAVSVSFGCMSKAGIAALLTCMGASATTVALTSGVVSILVPVAAGYVLYIVADELEVEKGIASFASMVGDSIITIADGIKQFLNDPAMKSKVGETYDQIYLATTNATQSISDFASNASTWLSEQYEGFLTWGKSLFESHS